jgi:Holliday junction resolvase RusA-like endonuclease
MLFEYAIDPVAKPRMTQADKWKKRPSVVRYRAYKDALRAAAVNLPEDGAKVVFYLPMPESWSKRKRGIMRGEYHRQTPDVDNLLKGLMDAVLEQDCRVASVWIEKRWADRGKITIQQNAWDAGDHVFIELDTVWDCYPMEQTLQELIETAKAAI